jgi:hypothetical protein
MLRITNLCLKSRPRKGIMNFPDPDLANTEYDCRLGCTQEREEWGMYGRGVLYVGRGLESQGLGYVDGNGLKSSFYLPR